MRKAKINPQWGKRTPISTMKALNLIPFTLSIFVSQAAQAELTWPKEVAFDDRFFDNSFYRDKGVNLTFSGRTYHLTSRNRNEKNDIIGIGYKGFELSTMVNSFYNRSYVFSYHKKWYWQENAEVGLRIGGITGYSREDNSFQLLGVTPLFAPTVTYHMGPIGMEVGLQTDVLIFTLNYQF